MYRKRVEAVLIQAWKESCRHIELTESFPEAKTLKNIISFERMLIRWVDNIALCIQTIAVAALDFSREHKRSLSVADRDRLRLVFACKCSLRET